MCTKFSILLGLNQCSMGCIDEESQSSKYIHEDEIVQSKGMVVSKIFRGKNAKKNITPIG